MKKESPIFIEHIIENINEIESFLKNKEKQYAVIRALRL